LKSKGAFYNLNADQIIYLNSQGVTQSEINALIGGSNATSAPAAPAIAAVAASPAVPAVPASAGIPSAVPAPPPAVTAPVVPTAAAVPTVATAAAPSLDTFRAELASSGTWVDVPGYGLCWRPAVASADPYWKPYCDNGHWVYSAEGWAWQSDYQWGDVVFHYGRWFQDAAGGWLWMPGYDWAPAWVCWRHTDGYCGWAPLPPAAVFRPGVGLWYNGRVAVDVDFGLGPAAFTFVGYDHFWDHNFHPFLVPHERVAVFYGRTVIMNGYRVDHGRFVVEGIGRERVALYTHHDVRVEVVVHDAHVRHEQVARRIVHEERRDDRRFHH
jgi:hypothetical protein